MHYLTGVILKKQKQTLALLPRANRRHDVMSAYLEALLIYGNRVLSLNIVSDVLPRAT